MYNSDFRVRVSRKMHTYPDLSVVCGEQPEPGEDTLHNPTAIFEVLSRSTEHDDRGLKFQHYRTIASLQDYILIDQNKVRVEQYTRQPDNRWTLRDYQGLDEELKIDSIGVSIPLSQIYGQTGLA